MVSACLMLYRHFNRSQYRTGPRYADYFWVLAAGITIRPRFQVLRVAVRFISQFGEAWTKVLAL